MENRTNRINIRLEKLREFTEVLRVLRGVTAQDLKSDLDKRAKAERFLQLAIEACVDTAELIISYKKLKTPTTAAQAIEILGEEGILDPEFAKSFAKAAGFRNILIHDYIEIDYEQVADKINNHLDDFDAFAKATARYLTAT